MRTPPAFWTRSLTGSKVLARDRGCSCLALRCTLGSKPTCGGEVWLHQACPEGERAKKLNIKLSLLTN